MMAQWRGCRGQFGTGRKRRWCGLAMATGAYAFLALLPLIAAAAPPGPENPPVPPTLVVEANGSLPGFKDRDLPTYLVGVMANVGPAAHRFVPPSDSAPRPPDRIEFSFRTNPYAAGTVRTYGFSRATMDRLLGVHHSVTIEARLFLGGEYQTLDLQQLTVAGGPNDPDLASAIAKLTRLLMAYADLNSRSIMPRRSAERHRSGTS